MRLHRDKKAKLSMFTSVAPSFSGEFESLNNFGRIIRDFSGKIIKITEFKDATEKEREIKEVNPGIYMFDTKWLWENIGKIKNKNAQGEYYLTDIVEVAIQTGVPVESLQVNPNEVFGINTIEQLRQAEALL
jgi:bifunctional N-acetylglucosamine-1-phosphate-uridyltransferase/glucosamine-1-phosphate-acetyltransferase GlmU-like protein